jgi:hypothetical protein
MDKAGAVGFHSGSGQADSGWGCSDRNIQTQLCLQNTIALMGGLCSQKLLVCLLYLYMGGAGAVGFHSGSGQDSGWGWGYYNI